MCCKLLTNKFLLVLFSVQPLLVKYEISKLNLKQNPKLLLSKLTFIYNVQTCVPAILPPLKELYPGDLAHDLSGTISDIVKYYSEVNIILY